MNQPPLQPYKNSRDGNAFRFMGVPTLVRSSGESTGGAFCLIEQWNVPPGFATPYHVHRREHEAFYVLEGQLEFVCDGTWLHAGPGDHIFGPRNIPHGFRVTGETPARMLVLGNPAGFEQFLLDMSEDLAAPPSPPDLEKLAAAAAKHQIEILGPLP